MPDGQPRSRGVFQPVRVHLPEARGFTAAGNQGPKRIGEHRPPVGQLGGFRFGGFFAWPIRAFIQIRFLIEFDNKTKAMLQWCWSYVRQKRGARLIAEPLKAETLKGL